MNPAGEKALLGAVFLFLCATGSHFVSAGHAAEDTAEQCLPSGHLTVALYGGLRTDLDWTATKLECSGMPRPDGEGARLRFSGTSVLGQESRQLAIIIGLPELKRGETVKETPSNLTIIEENGGRFFNSTEASSCLVDVLEQKPNAGGTEDEYWISGVLYCVAGIVELNGPGGITLTDMNFSGQLDWRVPE